MSLLGSLKSRLFNLASGIAFAPSVAWPKTQTWLLNSAVRSITTTPALFGEPLKKKKRMDPQIERARQVRKLRKLEKEIRKLHRHSRQLKPLDELQVPPEIKDNPKQRERRLPQLTTAELESRWLLDAEMRNYKHQQAKHEVRVAETLMRSQERALNELRRVSEDFYQAAIAIDESYLPFQSVGPVETPPLKSYSPPEGDYIDISRDWNKQ